MSRVFPLSLLAIMLIIIVLPVLLARGCRPPSSERSRAVERTPIPSPAGKIPILVFNHLSQKLVEKELEEYLIGVVAAEMPASFDLEALKAQAVVARTYTVNKMRSFGGQGCSRKPGADICTDPACCQAWESEEQSLVKWPAADAKQYLDKLRQAVGQTASKVVLHNGQTIDAVFHSNCGGHTENSEDVWLSVRPYLRGKDCPYCDNTRWSQTEHVYTGAQFARQILPYVQAIPVSSAGRPLLGAAVRSGSGRVSQLFVAGEKITGRDFRSALNLPSTNFTWRVEAEQVIFTVRGHGHGVGLCQYGANGMAHAGKTAREIINFYYTDVTVESLRR